MAEKQTKTNTTKKSKNTKPCKTKNSCNHTTYQTINVEDLSKQNQDFVAIKREEVKSKPTTPNKDNNQSVDMIIIHEEKKPWSLPFTISIAVATVLVFLAMITGFPTIMYTILSAG